MDPDQQPIVMDTPPKATAPINMDTGEAPPVVVNSQVASQRAFKATVGMPFLDKSYDDIYKSIVEGTEKQLRDHAATMADFYKSSRSQQIIGSVMAKIGRPLTVGEQEQVIALSNDPKPTDPRSVFEEYYPVEYMNNLKKTGGDLDLAAKLSDIDTLIPNKSKQLFNVATSLNRKQMMLQTAIENAQAVADQQSMGGFVADKAKEFLIPFYWNTMLRGNVPGVGSLQGGFLGKNEEAQAKELFRKDDRAFQDTLDAAKVAFKNNPSLEVQWLRNMQGMSGNDVFLDDIFSTFDLPVIGTAAKLTGKLFTGAKLYSEVRTATKSMLKQAIDQPATKAAMEEAVGNVPEAGVQRVTTQVLNSLEGNPVNATRSALDSMPSAFRTSAVEVGENVPQRFSRDFVNRLQEQFRSIGSDLMEAIAKGIKIDRIPAVMAVERSVRGVAEEMKNAYPGLRNHIHDIQIRTDPKTGLSYVDFYIGKNDLSLWGSESSAKRFLSEYGFSGEVVKEGTELSQQGLRYGLKITKPLDETQSVVRDALISKGMTDTPDSWINAFAGRVGSFRTPEETLSAEQRIARKVATYGPAWLLSVAKKNAEEVNALRSFVPFSERRQRWTEWKSVVDASQADRDARGLGKTYSTIGELDAAYLRKLNRLPDEQEVAAYFAWKRGRDIDDAIRNYSAYKAQHRLGAETWTVSTIDPHNQLASGKGFGSVNVTFNGIGRNKLPSGGDTVLFVGDKLGKERLFKDVPATGTTEKVYKASDLRGKARQFIEDRIQKGELKVIELVHPEDRPFESFGDKVGDARVKYVIVKGNAKSEPLAWEQVRRRPTDYDYEHYVKQAIVRYDSISGRTHYEGDRTVAAFNIRAMTKDVAKKLDQVRVLLRDGKVQEAKDFLQANPISRDFDEVYKWFHGSVTTEGLPIKPRLNLTEPIQHVPRNRMTIDQDLEGIRARNGTKGEFVDGTKDGYGRYFTEGRDHYDIFTARNDGTYSNPLYNSTPVRFLDPITSVNRAMTKSVNDLFMNDYKAFSVEHWIEEARHFMTTDLKDLRAAPYYYFYNPAWANVSGDSLKVVNNLKTAQLQIRQFMGIQDEHAAWLQSAAQRLSDSLYEKGSRFAVTPEWLLPTLRDPFSFIRGMTFHSKLGLFNPAQLLVQAQTFVTILGISGAKYALPGTKAAMLHTWARINDHPNMIARLDEMASKRLIPGTSEWKLGEWKEARDLLKSTGFEHVAGEQALRNDVTKADIIRTPGGSFLNAGTVFFREGEKSVRLGAWYTAYREFRDLHPTGSLGPKEASAILERADLLYTNMSRASSSTLHQGALSIPTQFLSYQMRLAELFMGKRLTQLERARLLGTYGLVYGFPTALGVTGFPAGDYIRKAALEQGYVVGDRWWDSAMTEGIPSMIMALSTGNWYNVGGRYGPQGFEPLRDALKSDKTMWDVIGGAAFSTLSNSIANMHGLYKVALSAIKGDGNAIPLRPDDFLDPFNEITSFSSGRRLIAALNTGQWLSKNETYISDVSKGNAIFQTLSGLSSQKGEDIYTMQWTREQEKDMQKDGLKYFIKEYRRGLNSQETSPDQARQYFTRAYNGLRLSGYPEEDFGKATSIALKGHEDLITQMSFDYYNTKVQEPRKKRASNAYIRYLQGGKQ